MARTRDLKTSLRTYLTNESLDPRLADALYWGYCRRSAVEEFDKWFTEQLPALQDQADPVSLAWAHHLQRKFESIRHSTDISQEAIRPKLQTFCAKYISGSEEMIAQLENGYCSGLASLVSYAMILEKKPIRWDQHGKRIPRDDWTWLKKLFIQLSQWNTATELSAETIKEIERMLSYIQYFQHIHEYLQIGHGDQDKSLVDSRNRKFKRLYSIGAKINEVETKEILDALIIKKAIGASITSPGEEKKLESVNPRIKPASPSQFIFSTSHNHDTSIIQPDDSVFYYDANNLSGPIEVSDTESLALLLSVANSFKEKTPSPLGFRVFSDGETGIRYPAQVDIIRNLEVVKKGLLNHEDKSYCNNNSSLDIATDIGCKESILALLDAGAEIVLHDIPARTDMFDVYVERKPDVSTDRLMATWLPIAAVYYDDIELLKKLLLKDPSFANQTDMHGVHVLHIAAQRGLVDIVELLILSGAHLTEKNSQGLTVAEYALQKNDVKMLKMLHKIGKLDQHNSRGRTLLCDAAFRGNIEQIKMLLMVGANPLVKSKSGIYPIYMGKTKETQRLIAHAMLAQHIRDNNSRDMILCYHYKPAINDPLPNGERLIFIAAKNGNTVIMRNLIQLKIDINAIRSDGKTALHIAAESNNVAMVLLLLKAKADTSIRCSTGLLASQMSTNPFILHAFERHSALKNVRTSFATHSADLLAKHGLLKPRPSLTHPHCTLMTSSNAYRFKSS